MINVSDPELEADGADGVSERQTDFSIPRDGIIPDPRDNDSRQGFPKAV